MTFSESLGLVETLTSQNVNELLTFIGFFYISVFKTPSNKEGWKSRNSFEISDCIL